MPFDPDKYLAEKTNSSPQEFNPDAYLAQKQSLGISNTKDQDPGLALGIPHMIAEGVTLGGAKHLQSGLEAAGDVISGQTPLEQLYNKYKQHLAQTVQQEQAFKSAHPIAGYGSEIAGAFENPFVPFLEGAGVIGGLAKNAPALAKIGNAAKTGAALAGTQAAVGGNKSLDTLATTEGVKDVATKTLGGGLLGGALGTAGVAADTAMGSLAEKEIPFISDAAKRYTLGREGTNLFDAKKLSENTADKITQLGDEGIGSQVKDLSTQIDKVIGAAEEEGNRVDLTGLQGHIDKLKQQIEGTRNPDVKSELENLTTYLEDRVLGPKVAASTKKLTNPEITGEIEPEVKTPSTESEPILSPTEGQRLEQNIGNLRESGKFTTPEAKQAAKVADIITSGKVNTATESSAYPEGYAPLRQQNYFLHQASENLGLPIKSPSDFYVRTPDGGATFNPDVSKALENAIQKGLTSPQDQQKVDLGFEFLKKAGVENIDALKESALKAIQTENLGVNPPALKSVLSPIGSIPYKVAKYAGAAPNAIGQIANPIANTIQNTAPMIQVPTGLGGPGNIPSVIGNKAINAIESKASAAEMPTKDYLGNDINTEKKSPENFSRQLYSANPEQLQNVASGLKNTKFGNYGESLEKAIQDNDEQKKRAILFVIASNPAIRETLQGPLEKAPPIQKPASTAIGNSGL